MNITSQIFLKDSEKKHSTATHSVAALGQYSTVLRNRAEPSAAKSKNRNAAHCGSAMAEE